MGFFPARTTTTTNIQLASTSPLLECQQQTSGPKITAR